MADEWAESAPVITPGTACSVSGVLVGDVQQEFWFRLGYRSPTEYLLCIGHTDDGTPLVVACAQATFFYDPLNGVLLEADDVGMKLEARRTRENAARNRTTGTTVPGTVLRSGRRVPSLPLALRSP
jgi:hypothetical protein